MGKGKFQEYLVELVQTAAEQHNYHGYVPIPEGDSCCDPLVEKWFDIAYNPVIHF